MRPTSLLDRIRAALDHLASALGLHPPAPARVPVPVPVRVPSPRGPVGPRRR